MFKKIIDKNNIVNLELFYEGNHNKTYKGFIYNEAVQVRVAKNEIVNHNNEIKLLKNKKDIVHIDQSIMIKKWIYGETLKNNDLTTLIKLKNTLTKHWSLKVDGITSFYFDNNNYYNDEDIVLSHGDLRPKNIIIDNKNNIHLIDFEWITYTSMYFDLAHLHLYCFFSIKDILNVFQVDEEKLKKSILSTKSFNLNWDIKKTNY